MKRFNLHRFDLAVALLVALVVLASCLAVQPAPAPLPLEPPLATPDWTPAPEGQATLSSAQATDQAAMVVATPESAKGCSAGEGQAVYTDAGGAFCFAFPSSLSVNGAGPTSISLVGPALTSGPEALFVSLGIESSPNPAGDLNAAVDAALAEYAGFPAWEITRSETTLGGLPALRVEPVPGRLSSRVLFAQRGDMLYRLTFWPADAGPAAPDLEALYADVSASFTFLEPGGDPAAADQAAAVVTGVVLHGERPVEGASVTLRTADWRTNPASVLMQTATDADGAYSLIGVPAGDFEVVSAWPDGLHGDAPPAAGVPVRLGAGISAATADLALATALKVLAPKPGAVVSASPSISWQPVEGAARYRVVVTATQASGDSHFAGDVEGSTLALEPPLAAGAYGVVVNALTEMGALLALGETSFVVE